MKNIIFIFFLFMIFNEKCFAQNKFARAIEHSGYSVIQTNDGGFAISGTASNMFIMKLDSLGYVEWSRSVRGFATYSSYGYSLTQTFDNGFILLGYANIFFSGSHDLVISKFTSDGVLEWSRGTGYGMEEDVFFSVIQTSDSSYVMAGYVDDDDPNCAIVKYTSSGNLEWAKDYRTPYGTKFYSIKRTRENGFVATGDLIIYDGYGYYEGTKILLIKLNSMGEVEWKKTLGDTAEFARSVIQTEDGGFVIVGYTKSYGAGETDLFIVKLDSTGSFEWARTVGGTNYDHGYSVIQTTDGGFVIAGDTRSYGAGESDLFLVKLDFTGSFEYARTVGGAYYDGGKSIIQTDDGGYAVIGGTRSYGSDYGLFFVKFDSEGNSCIGETITPVVSEIALHYGYISTITTNEIFYTNHVITPSIYDFSPITTEICTELGIDEEINPKIMKIIVSPNPFNSSCEIAAPQGAKVEIYDLMGNVVAEDLVLTQQQSIKGNRIYIWQPDASISSGIYLIKARVENQTITKRAIFIK